jgi:flagellar protein FliO/FliZ
MLTLIANAAAVLPAAAQMATGGEGPSLWRLLASLLFILALIFALAWVWRRGPSLPGQVRHMKVVETLSLGTREKLALITVGDKQFLLGVTPNQISPLHVFDQPVNPLAGEAAPMAFAEVLKRISRGASS